MSKKSESPKWKRFLIVCLIIVIILLSPVLFMVLVNPFMKLGITLDNNLFGPATSDGSKVTRSEYIYYYSQYLNVIVMGLLTFGIFLFAYKDYRYNHKTSTDIQFHISKRVYIASNRYRTYFHIPLTFLNLSKKTGIIPEMKLVMKVRSNGASFQIDYEPTTTVLIEINRDSRRMYNGSPFINIPIKGEDVIRETVTFHRVGEENQTNVEIYHNNEYTLEFSLNNQTKKFQMNITENISSHIQRFREEGTDINNAQNIEVELNEIVE